MYRDAQGLVQQGKSREAVAKLKIIQEVRPDYRDTAALIRKLEEKKKEKETVEKRVVTEKDRKQAVRLHRKGMDLFRNERLEEAIATWREALELDPESVDVRVDLSRAESKLRNLQRATEVGSSGPGEIDEGKRIEIKRHYIEGVTFYMNGLYAEAISEWEEVLELDPQHESARNNINRARKRLEVAGDRDSS
jgi:tetratricopeptide (TPR) repeat protein